MLIDLVEPLTPAASEAAPVEVLTQRDWTTPTDLAIRGCSSCGERSLRTLDPDWFAEFAPGRYVEPMMLTGGIYLDLFPDKTYAISSWCDLCSPAAHEYGRWESDGRQLSLYVKAEIAPKSDEIYWASFRHRFQKHRTLDFFVTLKGDNIHSSILVPTVEESPRKKPAVQIFLRKEASYSDWPSEKQKLVEAIEQVQKQ